MSPLVQLRLAAAAAILLLAGLGLWYLHHDGYEEGKTEVQAQWVAERERLANEHAAALAAYADKLQHAEEQHDQDQAAIDRLHDDAQRVHIHLPTCPAAPGAGKDGSAGVFPATVDRLFAEFQDRVGGLIRRCDQLNIDAIRANAGR